MKRKNNTVTKSNTFANTPTVVGVGFFVYKIGNKIEKKSQIKIIRKLQKKAVKQNKK